MRPACRRHSLGAAGAALLWLSSASPLPAQDGEFFETDWELQYHESADGYAVASRQLEGGRGGAFRRVAHVHDRRSAGQANVETWHLFVGGPSATPYEVLAFDVRLRLNGQRPVGLENYEVYFLPLLYCPRRQASAKVFYGTASWGGPFSGEWQPVVLAPRRVFRDVYGAGEVWDPQDGCFAGVWVVSVSRAYGLRRYEIDLDNFSVGSSPGDGPTTLAFDRATGIEDPSLNSGVLTFMGNYDTIPEHVIRVVRGGRPGLVAANLVFDSSSGNLAVPGGMGADQNAVNIPVPVREIYPDTYIPTRLADFAGGGPAPPAEAVLMMGVCGDRDEKGCECVSALAVELMCNVMRLCGRSPGALRASAPAFVGDPLVLLRSVRDRVMVTSAAGRYYAALYRNLSPALARALLARPRVLLRIAAAKDAWLDGLQALVDGRGAESRITSAMVSDLRLILADLRRGGSIALQRTLDFEERRLRLATLAGKTMAEFRQQIDALGGPSPCTPTPDSLCLQGGRYRVEVDWERRNGERGAGQAVQLTSDTGYFWFFDPANVETVVKVLDGCGVNGKRWVFSAGLTDVEVHTTVTDTWTGEGKRYENAQGRAFAPLQDTSFQQCGPASAPSALQSDWTRVESGGSSLLAEPAISAPSHACAGSATALCLQDGRFRVEATWRTADGKTGAGHAVPLTADTGYFWFFDAANVEAVVKVLDGCAVNERFWVFAAGLTDVRVELRVTDTHSGETKNYTSPQGRAFQPIQDSAAFAGCPR